MGYNILIVDDSEIIRAVVRKAIAMSGLAVNAIHEAGNGLEALERLDAEWIDIVFADINMPRMNGVELIRRMAASDLLKAVPVVVISTERSQTRMAELKRLGVRAYITKPFRPEDFREVALQVLGAEQGGVHGE